MSTWHCFKNGRHIGIVEADNQYQAGDIAKVRFGSETTVRAYW